MTPNALLIHPDDNVLICTAAIARGDTIRLAGGETLTALEAIGTGHKIARTNLAAGDKIIRYGAPIGSITRAVARGGHVHMHNAKSDYIPTHKRGGATIDD